ncbi:pyruvate kinase [Proteiniborus ethanoligenes]|uniref:Pyruvate kinase n=1 Tax=Proteiniborus ethanoligenes TaxID=415015 RepID=A0A1H3R7E5_9FIRM|nr:pyruvate kinase [Proteiniborus ethanoligenes]SDZ21580.1 pyruvate kinase [Proteiniborus ethanoligenes]
MKKTKIVCTIGPASESEGVFEKLVLNGLNVARLNFSHGTHEEHKKRIDVIKKVRENLDIPVAIMLDTKGPEIRTGDFKDGTVELVEGQEFTLTTRDVLGDDKICSITYEGLPNDVKPGDVILIDDGLIELNVIDVINNSDIRCKVINPGPIKNHKGVNVPGIKINLPAVTKKDIDDIIFGIKNEIDFIAASFIRKASDVIEIRRVLEEHAANNIQIISKIENQEGVDNIDEIIQVSDGIMVARGDLGVEIPTEEIPLVQKSIIKKCNEEGKPVITATQMLDSMMRNPRPTRAEVTDVANAILDGTDAIMLSGETAAGKYPLEAVKTMANIALRTEHSLDYKEMIRNKSIGRDITVTNAISHATCSTAQDLGAAAIVTATSSGYTAKAVSKFRPAAPIVAVTPKKDVMRKLMLVWGVYAILSSSVDSTDEVIDSSVESAIKKGYIKQGDLIVITAGIPVGVAGSTNLIKVHIVGEILIKGTGIGNTSAKGKICIVNNINDLESKFKAGDILVAVDTDRDMVAYMEKAAAIITEHGGLTSHAAIVGLNIGKPVIVGAADATTILKDGELVTIDSIRGLVYRGETTVL